ATAPVGCGAERANLEKRSDPFTRSRPVNVRQKAEVTPLLPRPGLSSRPSQSDCRPGPDAVAAAAGPNARQGSRRSCMFLSRAADLPPLAFEGAIPVWDDMLLRPIEYNDDYMQTQAVSAPRRRQQRRVVPVFPLAGNVSLRCRVRTGFGNYPVEQLESGNGRSRPGARGRNRFFSGNSFAL